MRKIAVLSGMAVVGVAGAGYLAGQAWSSHVFERELERRVAEWDRASDRHVWRDAVERGWFHSAGTLYLEPLEQQNPSPPRLALPYRADHGLLTTRLEGELQIAVEDAGPTLARHVVQGVQPHWQAVFQTLDASLDAALEVPAYVYQEPAMHVDFGGARVTLTGQADDFEIQADIAPWQADQGGELVESEGIHWLGRFEGDSRRFQQRNEVRLERVEVRSSERPTFVIKDLLYRDRVQLDKALRYQLDLALGALNVSGETLLSGYVNASLERLEGDAAREMLAQLTEDWPRLAIDATSFDASASQAWRERFEQSLLALAESSPRLVLRSLQLKSAMFGVEMHGNGEMTLDGQSLDASRLAGLEGQAKWRHLAERLDGRFTWHNVPPLLAMQLGLPLDTRTLTMLVTQGNVTLNGRPLPALF
ncbi:hypothetical protein GCM10027040_16280 [Halomonas shantousis]